MLVMIREITEGNQLQERNQNTGQSKKDIFVKIWQNQPCKNYNVSYGDDNNDDDLKG